MGNSRESGNPRFQRLESHFLQAVGSQSNNFAIILAQVQGDRILMGEEGQQAINVPTGQFAPGFDGGF